MSGKLVRIYSCVAMGLMLSVSFLGCGGGGGEESIRPKINATASGKVTSGGKPVAVATISFESPSLGAYGTKLESDGSFSVELSAGEYKVTVVPIPPDVAMASDGKIPTPPDRKDVPEEYRQAAKTPASFTAKEGSNTFDLELKK